MKCTVVLGLFDNGDDFDTYHEYYAARFMDRGTYI